MFTPAIAASSGSAPRDNISYARATPRSPFSDAITTGRPADRVAEGDWGLTSNGDAEASRGRVKPAAAAAPVARKSRRVMDTGPPEEIDNELDGDLTSRRRQREATHMFALASRTGTLLAS